MSSLTGELLLAFTKADFARHDEHHAQIVELPTEFLNWGHGERHLVIKRHAAGGALGRPRQRDWWSVSPPNDKYGMVTGPVPGGTSGRSEGPPARSVGGRFARKVKDSS